MRLHELPGPPGSTSWRSLGGQPERTWQGRCMHRTGERGIERPGAVHDCSLHAGLPGCACRVARLPMLTNACQSKFCLRSCVLLWLRGCAHRRPPDTATAARCRSSSRWRRPNRGRATAC